MGVCFDRRRQNHQENAHPRGMAGAYNNHNPKFCWCLFCPWSQSWLAFHHRYRPRLIHAVRMKPKWYNLENPVYENWIRKLPCLICHQHPVDCHHMWHARRNSYASVPLCRGHHTFGKDAYHALEFDSFEKRHNIDLKDKIITLLTIYIHKGVEPNHPDIQGFPATIENSSS